MRDKNNVKEAEIINSAYGRFFKRAIDLIICVLTLPLVLPIMLIVTVISFICMGSPVTFSQKRPGRDEKIFTIKKFRTMTNKKDKEGNLLPDAQRMTGYGNFLRKSSLDELPEIFNIIKGDMSLVGPRPLLPEYLPLYSESQRRRHLVRPGLTGLAQINGRNGLSWSKKFEYDVYYVDNMSFSLDCSIFFKTIAPVFKHDGITAVEGVTPDKFDGKDN